MKHQLNPIIAEADRKRFRKALARPNANGCRRFKRGQCEGYGRFWVQGETRPAHYVAFVLANKKLPLLHVCHSCGDSLCCEASHLYEGQGNLTTERNLRERFEEKFKKLPTDHPLHPGCWEWEGACDGAGYAVMKVGGRLERASHVSLRLAGRGDCPDGLEACHWPCNWPGCVNPDHLRYDTSGSNGHDKVLSGTAASGLKNGMHTCPESRLIGEKNPRAVLNERQVCIIRRTWANHHKIHGVQAALARVFRVNATVIADIASRKLWKHLPEDACPNARALPLKKLKPGKPKGKDSACTKLKESLVREIRYLQQLCGKAHGLVVTIRRIYRGKIGRTHILRILKGETWSHISDSFHRVKYVRRWFAKGPNGKRQFTVAGLKAGSEFMSP